ncbi:hypothetical protein BU25DRAFT_432756 [Macroventuria anomochaeta]|uniref:Uncharacterized protein n=1 Tax=Macroventuria anomochaeta TaxID=301207 RepID=A0ACB6RUK6_9PLEO|nr:uncharacterized protein BU25DRAFT_432756 [Macroventuria anomochaeta]KAF2625459.1 hypothetical protein BU25DRAFT_432756 [Macroventuria anomochaeta]
MHHSVTTTGSRPPLSSNNTTPTSTRHSSLSSLNHPNVSTASSDASTGAPKRSSMKTNLKPSRSVGANLNRRSAPPTVRFLDPEPLPRRTRPPQGRSQAFSGPVTQLRQRVDKRFSAPAAPSQIDPRLDPRWSGIPLPAGFVPPSRTPTPTQRTTSYQSVVPNLSSTSTPPVVTHPPSNKYDPLQNYISCMAAMCTAHYTPAHSGPTYYAAQEPYHLSKHRGYCPRHASKEMQEANALCKKEYESMRQNAGRKTLGVVAQDFDIFLQLYREARQIEDARLQKAQNQRVLGSFQTATTKGKAPQDDGFDWRYTPRNCTRLGCTSVPYSPFSTQHFSFYNTPNSSTQLLPLTTLCPSCSKAEAEGFGTKLMEKWSSRCGWEGEEWDGWYQNAIQARKAEQEFWEKAQERVKQEGTPEESVSDVTSKKEKRKSVFKRIFRRSETTRTPAVAVAPA